MASALSSCAEAPWVRASQPIAYTTSALPERRFDDPPGAALPLSIGGRFVVEDDDKVGAAIHCAAALSLTAERLAAMQDPALGAQFAVFESAEAHFLDQARTLAVGASPGPDDDLTAVMDAEMDAEMDAGSPLKADAIAARVERRREEKSAEVSEQAQLAIACLRRFGASRERTAKAAL